MKKKLAHLTAKIADLKEKVVDSLASSDGMKFRIYNGFLIHYEQQRAELLSNLGRK